MGAFLSQIVFIQPIILTGLLALPVLWYILRITPPAPKTILFPAARFLDGLVVEEQTSSSSPWWILLLRLLMAALLIFALAGPVLNPTAKLSGQGPLRLVIDTGWGSAQTWDMQMRYAEDLATQAGREQRSVFILTTAAAEGEDTPRHLGPMTSGEAISILRGLQPVPWPADYDGMLKVLEDAKPKARGSDSYWLSHGIDEGGIMEPINEMVSQGGVQYIFPPSSALPALLRPNTSMRISRDDEEASPIRIDVDGPRDMSESMSLNVQVMANRDGDGLQILDAQNVTLEPDKLPQTVSFEVAENMRGLVSQYRITGRKGAGGLFLLDDRSKRHSVGIAASAQNEANAPLVEASFFLRRAMEPFADVVLDNVSALIEGGVSVIILPDVAAMPTQTLNALEGWVEKGGILLRFSGPNMAESRTEPFLLPVRLRSGGRSLSGSLSWDEPQVIMPFEDTSPFFGLSIPEDITIKQQILADPAQDLEGKVWARLSDGTPFITADKKERGLIVLIHTTANTAWSNFALSGLYVSALQRIVQMSGKAQVSVDTNYAALDPILVMDGFGTLVSPSAAVQPLSPDTLDTIVPGPYHPPGLYGNGQQQYALNLGTNLDEVSVTGALPISVSRRYYDEEYEVDVSPYLLYAAMLLFLLDWLIMMFMIGNGFKIFSPMRKNRVMAILSVVVFSSVVFSAPAHASTDWELKHSSDFYLAFIETGDTDVDRMTRAGLESLAKTLSQRTSVEPGGVVALNPETDTLSLFPLIYWAISPNQKRYSDKALAQVQFYLNHGGTILFDTRDGNRSTDRANRSDEAAALRQITSSLNIPPVAPIPDGHVLGRAFYLLDTYPGRYADGILWLEQQSASGRDNVSSVLIGSNDWANAWAAAQSQNAYNRFTLQRSGKDEEMALRFGVNLVMYALTGNYKADQVHIPHILKRLDR